MPTNQSQSELDQQVQNFLHERQRLVQRRTFWSTQLKASLKRQLESYRSTYDKVGWYIHVYEGGEFENRESIYLGMENVPSGLVGKDGKLLMLMGGALHFSQLHDGKIRIWMEYPYIKDVMEHRIGYETLKTSEPEELTGQEIELSVVKFLVNMMGGSFEEPQPRRTIGFHRHPDD